MKTIIIGGVAGGASAAARLRRLNENDEIIYKDVRVIEIASNENSFIIMKSADIPTISLRVLNEEENLTDFNS